MLYRSDSYIEFKLNLQFPLSHGGKQNSFLEST